MPAKAIILELRRPPRVDCKTHQSPRRLKQVYCNCRCTANPAAKERMSSLPDIVTVDVAQEQGAEEDPLDLVTRKGSEMSDQECSIRIKEVISLVRTPRGPSPVEPTHPDLEAMEQHGEVVTLETPDPWCRPNYMDDVAPYTIVPTVNQLIASHLHRAAGACRWLGRDVIIWTEVPYTTIKGSKVASSDEIPWQKEDGTRKGKYSVLLTPGHLYWGLSPPVQKLWFNSDRCLRELGLKMEEKPNPFVPVEEYSEDNKIQVLVMKYPLIAVSPYREALRHYCALRD